MRRSAQRIQHVWPLCDRTQHFELGSLLDCASDFDTRLPRSRLAGWWECNLADNQLSWSRGVHDLFGFERGTTVTREQALARYAEHSRAILDRLRADAIRNQCGFTFDAELALPGGQGRWIRLVGAPDLANGQVVRLHGIKFAL